MKIMFVGAVILLCFVASIVFCIIAWIMTMKKTGWHIGHQCMITMINGLYFCVKMKFFR